MITAQFFIQSASHSDYLHLHFWVYFFHLGLCWKRLRRNRPWSISGCLQWLQSPAAPFLLWIIGFVVGISLAAKKFDRYALPVFPLLILLSCLGWIWFINRSSSKKVWWALLLVATLGNALYFQPNPLSAYNFLVGGPRVAQNVMTIGWGEAISLGTTWLEANYSTVDSKGVGTIAQAIVPFYAGEPLPATDEFYPQADYIIWTKNDQQLTGRERPFLASDAQLLHTIIYGGLTQAWIYHQPNPTASPFLTIPVEEVVHFDNRVAVQATAIQAKPRQIDALIEWRLLPEGENGRYQVRLTISDENGIVWQETELPLINETYFYPEHWPISQATNRYTLTLPEGTPPVNYALKVALVDEQTNTLLPLLSANNGFLGTAYQIGDVTLPAPCSSHKSKRYSNPKSR